MRLIEFKCSDARGHRLALGLNAHQVRVKDGTIQITPARYAKWVLLLDAGFDVAPSEGRYIFFRRGGPKLELSRALLVAQAVRETQLECAVGVGRRTPLFAATNPVHVPGTPCSAGFPSMNSGK